MGESSSLEVRDKSANLYCHTRKRSWSKEKTLNLSNWGFIHIYIIGAEDKTRTYNFLQL